MRRIHQSTRPISFTKMQGFGNDFIVISEPQKITSEQVIRYCDRHYGVGADGVLLISKISDTLIRMQYWNADGTSEDMCGNGLRCCVRYAIENKLVHAGSITVITDAGPLKAFWDGQDATDIEVQIGQPKITSQTFTASGLEFYEVYMGNHHVVAFVDNLDNVAVENIGQSLPDRDNIDFVQKIASNRLRLRTWERGAGETLACGTGMTASAAVLRTTEHAEFPIEVSMQGGTTRIWLDTEGYYRMRGPARTVYTGIFRG